MPSESRISIWGMPGRFSAMLRTKAAGERDFQVRATGSDYKSTDEARAAMRAVLDKVFQKGKDKGK